ncbi:unnamed protein product [Urochloa humidicola]
MTRIGCASIQLRGKRASQENIEITSNKSKKGWHDKWVYLKNDEDAPLHSRAGEGCTLFYEHLGLFLQLSLLGYLCHQGIVTLHQRRT